jgi:hypothetical protein
MCAEPSLSSYDRRKFPICHRKHYLCFVVKVKVKVTLVQALRLCTGRMALRGSRGIALAFLDHSNRRG